MKIWQLSTALLVCIAVQSLSGNATAADRVLIMTISDYPGQSLEGVKHDASNGLLLAQKMGYDTSAAVRLQDDSLKLSGMKNALQGVVESTRSGDRVFIYFSGHGGSSKRNNVCEQSILAQDGQPLFSEELSTYLDRVKDVASKVTIMLDSCHAGGVLSDVERTRSASKGTAGTQVKAKMWVPKDGESCSNGVNYVTRSIPNLRSAKGITDLSKNYVYITAARSNEYALDDPKSGGLASTSILKCLDKGVQSANNSGVVTVGELMQCAQPYIEMGVDEINSSADPGSSKKWIPPHINIVGNIGDPLWSVPLQTNTGVMEQSNSVAAKNTLLRILDGRDARWGFQAGPSQTEVPLGGTFKVSYASTTPGYVYVLYAGSDGKDFKQLYPINQGDMRFLAKTQGFVGKDGGTAEFTIEPPVGENNFLVVLAPAPRDFSEVFKLDSNGALKAKASADSAKNLGCAISFPSGVSRMGEANTNGCKPRTRNASVKEGSEAEQISGYGAAFFVVNGLRK